MPFEQLGLRAELLRAIASQGYAQPTPIQTQAIPVVLAGKDILAGAQTGTGKTAAFTLPILQHLHATPQQGKAPRALIVTPTRELAAQVGESVRTYSKYLRTRSAVIFGGVSYNPQKSKLERGVDVLVATPGRLLDHANQGTLDLSKVEVLVLDEADRMLDMGFIHDIRKIMALLPKQRQTLLFSATYSREIRQLSDRLLNKPELIEVSRRNTTVKLVKQHVYQVDQARKRALLAHLIEEGSWYQVLVFTRTKHGANRLAKQLCGAGIEAMAIHGNKSQNARTRALASFKTGELQVLVATDIAARGLDIDRLPYVVNFELPNVPEDYVHRIGRTGRAGEAGEAISLVSAEETKLLRDIERLVKQKIRKSTVAGFAPAARPQADNADKAQPRPRRGKPTARKAERDGNRRRRPRRNRRRASGQARAA